MPILSSFKVEKPFTAQADYISADFLTANPSLDAKYLNYISLNVEIPFIDGMVPLISTKPLFNYKHLLTDPAYSTNHMCSNFVDLNKQQFAVKYGLVEETIPYRTLIYCLDKKNWSSKMEMNPKCRK